MQASMSRAAANKNINLPCVGIVSTLFKFSLRTVDMRLLVGA